MEGLVGRAVQRSGDDRTGRGRDGRVEYRVVLEQVRPLVRAAGGVLEGNALRSPDVASGAGSAEVDAEHAVGENRVLEERVSLVAARGVRHAEAVIRVILDAVLLIEGNGIVGNRVVRGTGVSQNDPVATVAKIGGAGAVGADQVIQDLRLVGIADRDPGGEVPRDQIPLDEIARGLPGGRAPADDGDAGAVGNGNGAGGIGADVIVEDLVVVVGVPVAGEGPRHGDAGALEPVDVQVLHGVVVVEL